MSTIPRRYTRFLARAAVYPAVEAVWAAAFAAAGLLLRPRLEISRPSGRARVLVIAPHPDDEVLGCGHAIAAHVLAGDEVTVAVVTDGSGSRAAGRDAAQVRGRRSREVECAIEALGARAVLFGYVEGSSWGSAFERDASRLLEITRPDIIYAPSTVDYHPEHRRVALSMATLLPAVLHTPRSVRVYEVQVPLTHVLANVCVPGGETAKAARRSALACHASQLPSLLWARRLARYNAHFYRVPAGVEVFTEMSTEEYCSLVRTAAGARYRSLRPRPFSDPLAWLVGYRGRMRVSRALKARVPED